MRPVRPSVRTAVALLAAASASALLAACGSKTKTVSVGESPLKEPANTAARSASTSRTAPAAPAPSQGSGGTSAPAKTRSAPEPAFAQPQAGAEGAQAAAAVVRAHGFTPKSTSDYHSGQTLRVLLGTRTGSADGYGQQAFFFVNGRYIGTDTREPSAKLRVVAQGDTEVTLAYPLYRARDPLCCPSGGQARVTFQLNNGKLAALDPIPPLTSSTGLSRQ
jgi:LppP/LprE lipoprotein